jgi:hypothetical protein
MFYPFPRHAVRLQPVATTAQSAPTAYAQGLPPNETLPPTTTFTHLGGHTLLPCAESSSPPPSSSQPQSSVVLDDGLIAALARMTHRKTRAGDAERSRRRRQRSSRVTGSIVLAQEHAAAHQAQQARRFEGERKTRLYGSHASDMRALEAKVNQLFDRAMRMHRPPVWPSVHLRTAARS